MFVVKILSFHITAFFVLTQTEAACHAHILQGICRFIQRFVRHSLFCYLVKIINRFCRNFIYSSTNAKYIRLSVHFPPAQAVPSRLNISLSSFLCSASFLLCVFGLGSMVPVSNTVMETQIDRRSRTFRQKPF